MNINDQFESKYLKSSDLQGRSVRAKLLNVVSEKVGDDTKIVLYFVGKQKGMICNRTNSMTLAEVWGPETDNWVGGDLEIFSMKVPFQGKLTDGLRVRPMPNRQVAPQQQRAAPQASHQRGMSNPRDDWQNPPAPPPQPQQPAPAMAGGDDDPFADSDIPF
jgi:hypothetical protein